MNVRIEAGARTRASVAGVVVDEATGRPLAAARVEVVAGPAAYRALLRLQERRHGAAWDALPARLDRASAGPDGHFHLRGLPAGRYTLRASLPGAEARYGPNREPVTIEDGAIARVTLPLPPTLVRGRVTGRGGEPVPLAEVRLRGSAERTCTDREGAFVLSGVEAGNRVVEVAARGYPVACVTVPVACRGWQRTIEVTLES
jgi:hypothetical protein